MTGYCVAGVYGRVIHPTFAAIQLPPEGVGASEDEVGVVHKFLGAADWESDYDEGVLIHQGEADVRVDAGDWIVKGPAGFEAYSPDIFAQLFAKVQA